VILRFGTFQLKLFMLHIRHGGRDGQGEHPLSSVKPLMQTEFHVSKKNYFVVGPFESQFAFNAIFCAKINTLMEVP